MSLQAGVAFSSRNARRMGMIIWRSHGRTNVDEFLLRCGRVNSEGQVMTSMRDRVHEVEMKLYSACVQAAKEADEGDGRVDFKADSPFRIEMERIVAELAAIHGLART